MATDTRDEYQRTWESGVRPLQMTNRVAVAEISEREARLKRLILVGALASFVSLFGLTIAVDQQTRQSQVAVQATGVQAISSTSSTSSNVNGVTVVQPSQVRTKTS